MNTVIIILVIVLGIIIGYFLFRLYQRLRTAPGNRKDMTTKELIRNWQETRRKEYEYHEELRARAREQAKPEIEKELINRYKEQEIRKATEEKGIKQSLKAGLGLDVDKFASDEKMDRLLGRKTVSNIKVDDSSKVFNQDRLKSYAGKMRINEDKIRADRNDVDWEDGLKKGLKSNYTFEGVEKAVKRR